MDPILNQNAEMVIPVAKPSLGKRESAALMRCVADNWISQGQKVKDFEDRVAQTCNKTYGAACNSGTTALHLALHILDLKPEDEVIIPNMTMIALANACLLANVTPVFAESDPKSLVGNISLETIKREVTPKTKAIIVVHTYGEVVKDIEEIASYCKEQGIILIEDCAEAHFASLDFEKPAGSFGDLAIMSFYSNKNITCGEGGMVLTNSVKDKMRLDRVRMHAFTHGQHFCHTEKAFGYRMTDMQAAIGLCQLDRSDSFMKKRRDIRFKYSTSIVNDYIQVVHSENTALSGAWVMPLLAAEGHREKIREHLATNGIDTRTYFFPMTTQVFLQKYKSDKDYSHSEYVGKNGFYLPLYPDLTNKEVNYIIKTVNSYGV